VFKFSNASLLAQDERVTDGQLADEMKILRFSRSVSRTNRRNFVTSLGIAAGAAGTLGLAGCSNDGAIVLSANDTNPSVVDVLNFALNLEYLEASFYNYIATGSGISSANLGTGAGTITPIPQVTFANSFVTTLAQNLAAEEALHVAFLRSTITAVGGTPVSAPSINLAAMGAVTNDATFLALARTLEGVGSSAYAGGAQYLTSTTVGLTYAAQILHVEAQHEGALRQACIQLGVSSPAADSLDTPPSSSAIFNTGSTTGLNPVRTVSQVLQIVYAKPGLTGQLGGGFFPNGLSGNLTVS
jgi:hypothetical protein